MVREFLTNLGTRWDDIPNDMRNSFLRVILDCVLIEERKGQFNMRIIWRSGFEQRLVIFRPATSSRKRKWTEEEKKVLYEHYATASREELEEMLPERDWQAIKHKAYLLGLKRGYPDRTGIKNPHWAPEEDQILRNYDECKIGYSEMLEALRHRPRSGIVYRAQKLGILLRKRRIVWRFVDVTDENGSSPGPPPRRCKMPPSRPADAAFPGPPPRLSR